MSWGWWPAWPSALPGPWARAGAYDDYFRAIEVDNVSELQQLLARGMDPNTVDPKGQHGLFLALRGGSDQVGAGLDEPSRHPRGCRLMRRVRHR